MLVLADKPLTAAERLMTKDTGDIRLARAVYDRAAAESAALDVVDVRDAFRGDPRDLWIDLVHNTPDGAAVLADHIVDEILRRGLNRKRQVRPGR